MPADAAIAKLARMADRAWDPYVPDARRPWNLQRAAHLYRRAAFGATWSQLEDALADGPRRTVEKLLRAPAAAARFESDLDAYEDAASMAELPSWWLRRTLLSPHPLREKMTLFWHGYFAVQDTEVKSAQLLRRHVRLLRREALGNFETLLEGMSHDPALLASLGCTANRKARPSDGLARNLMELFTLGRGKVSEQDIREAARAFTGWFVLRGELRYIPREHDTGVKRILGKEGNFGSKDVVRIAVRQPATPRHVVRRLYRELIAQEPDPPEEIIDPLAQSFAKDYDIAALVGTMLRSNLFFSRLAYRRRVKSPVEFAMSIIKPLEGRVGTTPLAADLADLGQHLYRPPTSRGWRGGRNWINPFTLISRNNLAAALLSTEGPYAKSLDPLQVASRHDRGDPPSAAKFLLDILLDGNVPEETRAAAVKAAASPPGDAPSDRLRHAALRLATLPEFHLA